MKMQPYSKYKDSGVEWLGKVPEHWEVVPVKAVATCNDEVLPESMDEDFEIEYVEISDVKAHQGIIQTERLSFCQAPSRARRCVSEGDILVSTVRTYLRAIAMVQQPASNLIASTGFAVIRPRSIKASFLGYLFHAEYLISKVIADSVGVSYPAINASELMRLPITLPPTVEQLAIAAFLDRETSRIDALIAKKTRFIELLREKRQALITRAVTKGLDPTVQMKDSGVEWLGAVPEHWEVKAIKRESLVQRGASPRPIDDPVYFDDRGEYAWVRISDVTASEMYLYETEQRLSSLGSSLSVKMQPGSLFLSIAGSVGKPCIARIKCCIHDGFVYFPNLKNNPKFLFYIFVSGQPYSGLGKMGTQLNLNTDTVASIYIASPPIEEQLGISIFLGAETAKIDALIAKIEQSKALLREGRSALVTATVAGKICLEPIYAEQ
jgi:type I restriction enzyme S subunit